MGSPKSPVTPLVTDLGLDMDFPFDYYRIDALKYDTADIDDDTSLNVDLSNNMAESEDKSSCPVLKSLGHQSAIKTGGNKNLRVLMCTNIDKSND